jgi:hypothetical protein
MTVFYRFLVVEKINLNFKCIRMPILVLVFNLKQIGACQNFDIFDMTYVDMGQNHLRHVPMALPKVHIDFGVDTTN